MGGIKKKIDNSIINGLFWKFAERFSAQLVSFVISMILARILMPEDYGVVAILLAFINIANVFVAEGFSTSLIQKKEADELDFSTMFYCSLVCSIVIFLLLFWASPVIAAFYDNSILKWALRILALKLPIAAFNSIQHAYVSRHMIFKKIFFSTLIGTMISAIVGICMAYLGFGPWALVFQYLTNSLIETILLFFAVPWKPRLLFSRARANQLIKFGWKVMVGSLISSFYSQIRSLLIGKKYTSSDLAFYNKGEQFPVLFVNNINSSISAVLFPVLAIRQNSQKEVKKLVKKSMRFSAFVIFPLMGGLASIAENLVILILTEKWLPCVPFLQLACIAYALQPISTSNLQAINALGRSDLFMKMEIIKKVVGILLIVITMKYGTFAIAVSAVLSSIFSNTVNIFPNKKLFGYGFKEQIKDLCLAAINTFIMMILVCSVTYLEVGSFVTLMLQIIVGGISYIMLSVLTKSPELCYLVSKIRTLLLRKDWVNHGK